MYDDLIAGYFAIEIMYNKIKERYYWPKMYEDIKIYPYKKGMLGKCHQNVWIYLNMSGKCPKKWSNMIFKIFSYLEFVHVNQTYSEHKKILDASQTNQTEHFLDMKKFWIIFLKMDKLIL